MSNEAQEGWNSGPTGRGTMNILWACLSTLALCVWTAVHPNITLSSGSASGYFERGGMMILAIVFPEIILSSAYSQYQSARRLCDAVNKARRKKVNALTHGKPVERSSSNPGTSTAERLNNYPEETSLAKTASAVKTNSLRKRATSGIPSLSDNPSNPVSGHEPDSDVKKHAEIDLDVFVPWTADQGFFAVMGGFVVEYNEHYYTTSSKYRKRRIVTADGILEMAKAGLLPNLSRRDVLDRSRADIFAKLLVISQIVWFGLQVIGRLAARIVVTPLEAHTAVHVLCTVLLYLIWLKKPYNVDTPVTLSGDKVDEFTALFRICEFNNELYGQEQRSYEKIKERYWRERYAHQIGTLDHYETIDQEPPPEPPVHSTCSQTIDLYTSDNPSISTAIDDKTVLLRKLAPAAQRSLDLLSRNDHNFDEDHGLVPPIFLRDSSENFMIKAVWGSWSTNVGHEVSQEKAFHLLFNLLYGAGHLAAWESSSFPTTIELWLWRGSSLMLVAGPLWGSLWILWWQAVGSKKSILFPFRNGDFDVIAGPFFFLIMMTYVFARCYFLIESLICLRLLPPSAYESVQWSGFLPHLS